MVSRCTGTGLMCPTPWTGWPVSLRTRCRSVVSSPTGSSPIRPARIGITPTRFPTLKSPAGCSDHLVVTPEVWDQPAGRRLRGRAHLRRGAHHQRQHRGSPGCGATGAAVPGPGHQHRQRADEDLDQRALTDCSPSTAPTCTSPPTVSDRSVTLTAGGRADLEVAGAH